MYAINTINLYYDTLGLGMLGHASKVFPASAGVSRASCLGEGIGVGTSFVFYTFLSTGQTTFRLFAFSTTDIYSSPLRVCRSLRSSVRR